VAGRLIYSMTPSLDGFIAARDGDISWSAPGAELHRFHNQQVGALGAHLCGRRLYEVMRYWDTVAEGSLGEVELEFARIWRRLPKIVFSTTLRKVEGNARLAEGTLAEELETARRQTDHDIGVGGAGLAGAALAADLVDELRLFVIPVLLGDGTPYFPAGVERVGLQLLDTRTFGSRVVYLRYGRMRA
jgi:dihydrofolate reductase